MSIVGPRPALPREVAQYNEYQMQRLLVKQELRVFGKYQEGIILILNSG